MEAATTEPQGKSDGEPLQDYGTQVQDPSDFYRDVRYVHRHAGFITSAHTEYTGEPVQEAMQ